MLEKVFSLGPQGTVHIWGIKLVGFNSENADKLIISAVFLVLLLFVSYLLRKIARRLTSGRTQLRTAFWVRQGINLATAVVLVLGISSIWFDDPSRLATALGLITAGLAFALQKVVTSLAGYFVILRGKTFNVGDRIVMGGVRGDVVALGFMQTSIMEMGQPHDVQQAKPEIWIKSRQYTGRVVTVPNSKIFDEPVYNYTRDFPYIWEEFTVPISYQADRRHAETILLRTAQQYQLRAAELDSSVLEELRRRYDAVQVEGFEPRVFLRMTDNWIELAVRFLTLTHGVRDVKDQMTRRILDEFEEAEISVASATFEIVGLPRVQVCVDQLPKSSKE